MADDPDAWATVAVRVRVPGLTCNEISKHLGIAVKASSRHPAVWTYDVPVSKDLMLNEHLDALSAFLTVNKERFAAVPEEGEVDVVIGWRPRRGQDVSTFTPELVACLARLGAGIVTWTYSDDRPDEE
ncbi:hypothetical protein [Kribbella lupini]|uniref:DUF4279 domain-containing protein n=1 Tax=Kribbella lupini TaxID=291602 RepID=A0ABN2BN60_9ACTN